ncbi:hypothetical protein Tco_0475936 [Tanacetum coccineum]
MRLFQKPKKKSNFVKPKLLNLQLMNHQRLNSKTYLPILNTHSWKMTTDTIPSFAKELSLGKSRSDQVQHQRRVNPKIHDVIKNEVEKLLDAGLIYPISDSPWSDPIH